MNDYILAFDDNGSPYIAHAFWNRKNQNGSKRDFKYFQKIKEGLKTRYFYSKEEWDEYMSNLELYKRRGYVEKKSKKPSNGHSTHYETQQLSYNSGK